MEFKVLSLKL